MRENEDGWRVADVMREPVCVEPHDSVTRALLLMQFHGVGHLVVTGKRHLVGLVVERELRTLCRAEHPREGNGDDWIAELSVEQVMILRPATLPPSASLSEAADLLRGRAIACVPIVEDGRVVGTVTHAELLGAPAKTRDRSGDAVIGRVALGRLPARRARPAG